MLLSYRNIRNVPLLISAMIGGFAIIYLFHVKSELAPFNFMIGVLLPFLLAFLTGVTKTTTV